MLLCFGDSNTWGFNPAGGRYAADIRWPTRLAAHLGLPLREEGQPGRTLQAERPEHGLCSGLGAWQQALTHHPDLIVLALGINELAAGSTANQAVSALEHYLQLWQRVSPSSRLVLLTPSPLGALQAGWKRLFAGTQSASTQLPALWLATAKQWHIKAVDPSPLLLSLPDGVHWCAQSHAQVANALAQAFEP
ncbi:MAG: GDSL-type esterase/lipase family protein [Aeromonadaceae bacterium]